MSAESKPFVSVTLSEWASYVITQKIKDIDT
jgi:hypothetical protein